LIGNLPAGEARNQLAQAMVRAGFFAADGGVIVAAAWRWIDTFIEAYGEGLASIGDALALVQDLRAEAVIVPAIEIERLRNRQVLFFLDAVSQYVDGQPELRSLPLAHDLAQIGHEFGVVPADATYAVRMALTGLVTGPPLELLFPLLGHDRIMMRIGAVSSHLLHGRGLEPIKYGPDGKPFKTIEPAKPLGSLPESQGRIRP